MAVNGSISPDSEDALIVWVNSFPLDQKAENLKDLNDGQVLWRMLRDIDGESFSTELPNNKPSAYSRRQNLQFLHSRVQDYLEERNKSHDGLSDEELERMASQDPGRSTTKFLKLILNVMLESPTMTEQVQKIMGLPPATQEIVGGFMQEVADFSSDGEAEDEERENLDNGTSAPDARAAADQILQLEQQYARVMSQLERRNQEFKDLEVELENVGKSLERAQENNEALNSQMNEKDDQLKRARSLASDREHSSMKDLETKISIQEETISSRENQLTKHQSEISDLQREQRRLLASEESLQKLQDEFDVMKVELEKQTRKANTADKYMQKLQANQSMEKERDSLRSELEDARSQLGTVAKLRQENAALQKSNDEASRTLSQIEQEHEELRMTKKQLRVNYDSLARQVDALNERFAQDQEIIAELRDKHVGSEAMSSPTVVNGGLEGELNDFSKNEDQARSKFAELQKNNQQLLSDTSDKDAKITTLQRQLNIAMESAGDYTGQISHLREELVTLQTSLAEVREGHPIEGTETFRKMREQVKTSDQQLADLQKEISSLKQGGAVPSTQDPKEDALQSGDNADGLAELRDLIKKASDGQSVDVLSGAVATKLDQLLATKLSDGKDETAKQQKQIEEQETTIQDLKHLLQKEKSERETERKNRPLQQSAQDRNLIQNLERELKLMASAYHDLAGRLQMNTVVLQRRAEAPKSWLGRQRRAMEGPTGLMR